MSTPGRHLRRRLVDRPIGELLILAITATVCFAVIAGGAALTLSEAVNPENDVSAYLSRLSDIINTLIGLLAGFVAGRTDLNLHRRPPEADERDSEP